MSEPAPDDVYRLIVDSALDFAIFTMDPEGKIETWNPGAERMFLYTAEEAIGQPGGFIFTAEDRAIGEDDREIAIAASEGRAPDNRWHVRKDGSRVWANGVMHAVRDQDGVVVRFIKVIQDRTDERRMQENVAKSEEQFARLFLGNPAAVVVERQHDERLILANEAFFHLTGFWRAELMGRRGQDFGLWANPDQRQQAVKSLPSNDKVVHARIDIKRKTGEPQPCLAALRRTFVDSNDCLVYSFIPLVE